MVNALLAYAVGPTILALLLAYVLYRMCRRQPNGEDVEAVHHVELAAVRNDIRVEAPTEFTYDELCRATGQFSASAKIGEGQFGDVYKAEVNGVPVAIKKLKQIQQGPSNKKEFVQEVNNSAPLMHRNLVKLIGYSHHQSRTGELELLVVFEFVPNGTLHDHLYGHSGDQSRSRRPGPLSWENRYKIALGLASGVSYLHGECNRCLIHRDIKPQNVMLDMDFTPKLGDFGLARSTDHGRSMAPTLGAGTIGYIAPEVSMGEKASKESDVFSFGIVALEIATGRLPRQEPNLVSWVWDLNKLNRVLEAVDKKLGTQYNIHGAKRLLLVGLLCCQKSFARRPTMEQAKFMLNNVSTPLSERHLRYLAGNFNDVNTMSTPSITSTQGISHGTSRGQPSNSNISSSSGSTQYHTPAQSESDMQSSRFRPPPRNARRLPPARTEGLSNISE